MQTTRRNFLSLSSTLAAGIFAAPAMLRSQSPNSKLNIAMIGVGGQANSNYSGLKSENIVALCDVDSNSLAKAAERSPGARQWSDYRKMFDELKDYDAVVVTTPDHHHFPATMRALKAGKHVYCEKPLTHSIWEARQIRDAAEAAKVATQMGNQGNAGENIRLTTEWIQSGAIGAVREVHAWSNRPIWPQGVERPKDTPPVPETLNWDVWLGPAPERPYSPAYHPFKWRGFWDFGTGALGDMGCHILNWPFTALSLDLPQSVECLVQQGMTKESPPVKSLIAYDFPAGANDRGPVRVYWHDGGLMPTEGLSDIPLDAKGKMPENGTLFIGEKGKLWAEYDKAPKIVPTSRASEFTQPPKTLPRSPGHHVEFIQACKGSGKRAGSDFVAKACRLTEFVLLGNLAVRAGNKKIEWDAATGRAKNNPGLDKYIHRDYRPGWIV
jgi:predicted dehydrogenase